VSRSFEDYIRESLVLALDDAAVEMWTDAQVDQIASALATSIENWSTACPPTPSNPALDQYRAKTDATLADKQREITELERLLEIEKDISRRLRRDVEKYYR